MEKLNNKGKKGFTLIELLVVLIVIGILLTLIIPKIAAAINSANVKASEANKKAILAAVLMCKSDNNNTYTAATCGTTALLNTGGWLQEDLKNPKNTAKGYTIAVDATQPSGFLITETP